MIRYGFAEALIDIIPLTDLSRMNEYFVELNKQLLSIWLSNIVSNSSLPKNLERFGYQPGPFCGQVQRCNLFFPLGGP